MSDATKPIVHWCVRDSEGRIWSRTVARTQCEARGFAETQFKPRIPWPALRRLYGLTIVRVEIREIGK